MIQNLFKHNRFSKTSLAPRERFCLAVSFLLLLSFPIIARAQLAITEIMYDLSGSDLNEWIEVQNISSQSVDLSNYKLFENNSNHGLKVFQGDANILAGSYAIIANDPSAFLSEYTNFNGTIFDSSFNLSNTGETLVIRDSSSLDIDTVIYTSDMGANGDGMSLQKNGNNFKSGTPTPGIEFDSIQSSVQTNQDNQLNSQDTNQTKVISTYSTSAQESKNEIDETFSVSIGKDRLVAVGNEVAFKAEVKNKNSYFGRGASFSWSMGDGTLKYGEAVTYNYRYPGEYVVVLNASRDGKDIVARTSVKVFEPEFNITALSDGSVEIENLRKEEINMYLWKIESIGKIFTFPKDTLIKGHQKVVIPKDVLGIDVLQVFPIILKSPIGVVYNHRNLNTKIDKPVTANQKIKEDTEGDGVEGLNTQNNLIKDEKDNINLVIDNKIESDNQVANVSQAIEVSKPKGFWKNIFNFFLNIFD